MKKIFIGMLLAVFLIGCDGIENGVIDPSDVGFTVKNITAPTELSYTDENTEVFTKITFSNTESIKKVWVNIISQDGIIEIVRNAEMISPYHDDENTYSITVKMQKDNPTGIYLIEYFVTTVLYEKKKIGSHNLLYDNTRDVEFEGLDAPNKFVYSEKVPFLRTKIRLSNTYKLKNVWFSLKNSDHIFVVTDSIQMSLSQGGSPFAINTYIDSVKMKPNYPVGNYIIEYYIKTTTKSKKIIATHNFIYESEGVNVPPVISNPLFYYEDEAPTLRDTLENNKPFIFSIEVYDENGLNDIDSVYTDFYSPNNPSAIRVLMFDDGDEAHGDKVAGDGIYSLKNIFQNAKGDRKFEFRARDRAGELSNMITHNVVVK